jgi:sialate O-acetylesterase
MKLLYCRINLALAILFIYSLGFAQVKLPAVFGNHMVLQRQQPIPVWGWAKPGEKISVSLNNKSATAKADKAGKWKVQLPAEEAGGPYTLTVKASNTIVLEDVLIGEVWLCSGQSNMEWNVAKSTNGKEEIAAANYPNIRHFKVGRNVAGLPQEDVTSVGWLPATPEHVGNFTGVGYFFAKHLQKELNVPIGLINSTWGGTHVETWTGREAFENDPEFSSMIKKYSSGYIDSIKTEKEASFQKLKAAIEARKQKAGNVTDWALPNYNATDWAKLKVPGFWEQQGLAGLDGVVWFRKEIQLTEAQAAAATLHLAMIDDNDVTWVNGAKVGETTGYNVERAYKIPAGLLKPGKNIIALRIDDPSGNGGISGKEEDIYLSFADGSKIPLAGQWLVNVEKVTNSGAATAMGPNEYPTLLFNGMINPIIPYGIRGALWYQGESNTGRAFQYRKSFPLMINDWRKRWAQGDFPFYFVQLATFFAGSGGNKNSGNEWAELREAQTLTLSLPNTGMAVTTDIGNPKDIHPINKQDVGKRLALQALQKTYGRKNLLASGPVFEKATAKGNQMVVSFNHTGSGLTTADKYGYLYGFEVAGIDQQWHFARAWIVGNTVLVESDKVSSPVALRYNWTDNAEAGNLFNKEGLPAAPFRTDNWKRSTEGKRFME